MEHSSIVDLAGWRSLIIQLGLIAVGVLSILILFSFGGQLIVAPGLLPAQWLIARHSDGWVSSLFAVLGSLLAAEVLLICAVLVLGDGLVGPSVGVLFGLVAAMLFFRTSRRRE
ncbi:MAG: hypothetical protein QNJ75_11365 [Acidimicrobiia bacterium]|nr:hypothetical protein [Acidimicrobiia bacterium]